MESQDGIKKDVQTNTKRDGIMFMVFATAFYCLQMGVRKSNGVYFVHFQGGFGATAAEVSAIYSITVGLASIGGPVYGLIYTAFGPRTALALSAIITAVGYLAASQSYSFVTFVIFYSIVTGIGRGIGEITIYTMIGQRFDTARNLANNVIAATSSMFSATYAPFLQIGIESYTWHGIMLIECAILCNNLPFGWMASKYFVLPASKETSVRDNDKNSPPKSVLSRLTAAFDAKILSDPLFLIYCTANYGILGVRVLQSYYLVRYAQSIGIDEDISASFLSIYQGTFVVLCLLMGLATCKLQSASHSGTKLRTSALVVAVSILQVMVALVPVIWSCYEGYLAYAILAGCTSGLMGSMLKTLAAEFFGTDRLPAVLGFRAFSFGALNLIVPPLIGGLIDRWGSYHVAQYAMVVMGSVGSLVLILVQFAVDKREKRKRIVVGDEFTDN